MARKSKIEKDKKRRELVMHYKARRDELRNRSKNPHLSEEERVAAREQLGKLPKDSCPTRITNRCSVTGRSRGNYYKFGVSRIAFRELALSGKLPGVRKSSW